MHEGQTGIVMLVNNGENSHIMLIIAAILILGLIQLYLGYIGIENWLGTWWAMGALGFAILARIMLPLTVGTYLALTNVYGYDWWVGLIVAAPGILFLIPQFFIFVSDKLTRISIISRANGDASALNIDVNNSNEFPSISRKSVLIPKITFSNLLGNRLFIACVFIFSIFLPLTLSSNLIYMFHSIFSIFALIVIGIIIVKRRMFYAVIIFSLLSAFLNWGVFGYSSIDMFSPLLLFNNLAFLFF